MLYVIQRHLIKAIKKLNRELNLIESIRIDHDTLGVAGSPDITSTILSKIDESDIFIGDISFLCDDNREKIMTINQYGFVLVE